MSMLTAQCAKLRKAAYDVERIKNDIVGMSTHDVLILAGTAMQLREAADTIADLRNQLTRTCHMVTDHDAFDVWLECDECGCILPNPCSMPKIQYCPQCGAKVVI